MNADGSGQRRYPFPAVWSLTDPGWQQPCRIADDGREIRLLNLATGTSRVLVGSGAAGVLQCCVAVEREGVLDDALE